ncbi:MAG TPA: VCBS repeat-containing protein [Pyrinomonadaceae bacterium]|nr:VCBS repeat-containing protein [Pyrinomonadaceae bacterium]
MLVLFVCTLQAQTPPETQPATGGVSTGAARNYTTKRTVDVTDPSAPVVFTDVTDKTPLREFVHRSSTSQKNYIFEAPSGAVALFDYDGDELLDIYLLNGSTVPALQGKEKPPRSALYRNLGGWKFEDVTTKAGVANERWGMGVAVADCDNDGKPDLFVSNLGVSRLYHNNGDGTFTDVAEKLNVARKGWSTGATWGDDDGDGRLDLVSALPPDVRRRLCLAESTSISAGLRPDQGRSPFLGEQALARLSLAAHRAAKPLTGLLVSLPNGT